MNANEEAEKDVLAAMAISPNHKDCEKLLRDVRNAMGTALPAHPGYPTYT